MNNNSSTGGLNIEKLVEWLKEVLHPKTGYWTAGILGSIAGALVVSLLEPSMIVLNNNIPLPLFNIIFWITTRPIIWLIPAVIISIYVAPRPLSKRSEGFEVLRQILAILIPLLSIYGLYTLLTLTNIYLFRIMFNPWGLGLSVVGITVLPVFNPSTIPNTILIILQSFLVPNPVFDIAIFALVTGILVFLAESTLEPRDGPLITRVRLIPIAVLGIIGILILGILGSIPGMLLSQMLNNIVPTLGFGLYTSTVVAAVILAIGTVAVLFLSPATD